MSGTNEAPSAPNVIALFWYPASPYGRRVKAYLTLRNIDHAECIQPPILPRPDLDALGVKYRRSPVMAIGRDVYLDTRLMISKLEEMFPASSQHPGLSSPETNGLAQLLQKLSIDGSIFQHAVRQIPRDSALMKSPAFQKDRAGFFGPQWDLDDARLWRPEAIIHMQQCFDIIESLFIDGRSWVAGTETISLADLEGVWVLNWFLNDLNPTKEVFSEDRYPKVHAWVRRYRNELDVAKARVRKSISLGGANAVRLIVSSEFSDKDTLVDENDPLDLKAGVEVDLFPTDGGGFTHQDRGSLIKLTKEEVAIAVQAQTGEEIRIHAPRWQFRVRAINNAARL
ncbi:hypothetical protein M409DRAFT_18081 [Zasmidium cellare ATCC 36951]|uniref:Uncharacterized protein n=1 Tax=Zasmidium cellare ATCC 36951 TaxID=1080233 RepID=A0A6A6D0A6_ZASCE|nr:uncharacterized protein M409DRAFT_18081 [Zasmidium cellare ATCC 36951]KAF2171848.1 hypothetical protein M409DRAFT_18081 [Zasmidium cellare ATCC 36951]